MSSRRDKVRLAQIRAWRGERPRKLRLVLEGRRLELYSNVPALADLKCLLAIASLVRDCLFRAS